MLEVIIKLMNKKKKDWKMASLVRSQKCHIHILGIPATLRMAFNDLLRSQVYKTLFSVFLSPSSMSHHHDLNGNNEYGIFFYLDSLSEAFFKWKQHSVCSHCAKFCSNCRV